MSEKLVSIECPDCDGGVIERDDFSYKSGHFTTSAKCEWCGGTGNFDVTGEEAAIIERDAVKAECARLRRELNAAHERIVALTKQLQAARPGGDASRAVATSGESPTLTEASTIPTPLPSVSIPAGTQGDAHIGLGV